MKVIVVSIAVFLLCTDNAFCQRFSQFYTNPLVNNPASTGMFNQTYRYGGSFKSEESRGAIQSAFSIEGKFFSSIIPANDGFAIGLVGHLDKNKNDGVVNTNYFLSIAYNKALDDDGNHILSAGFQPALSRKKINRPLIIFPDQMNNWLNSGYTFHDFFPSTNVDFTYLDMNVGIAYQGLIGKTRFGVGTAVKHINNPSKSFNGGNFILKRSFVHHLSVQRELQNENVFYSALLVEHSGSSIDWSSVGLTYQKKVKNNISISGGTWVVYDKMRGYSIRPEIGLSLRKFNLNFSFEISFTQKNPNQGSVFEASFNDLQANSRTHFLENRFIKF